MSKVALVSCSDYDDYERVKIAVEKGINLLGGLDEFVSKGEKILLKPNLLAADEPERCSTTHFVVFKAVAEVFKRAEILLKYGDSPGYYKPETVAKKNKIAEAAQQLGIELADFENGKEILFEEGRQNKKFIIANGILESDGIISIPKFKTHALTRMTCCVKNQFGCIPGFIKGRFHAKMPDIFDFCKMLVDLNNFVKPRLYVVDAIYAMEGNGPRSGTPKKMGLLMFSRDPIAVDSTLCRLVNLNPEYVPTNKIGMDYGSGTYYENEIEIVGEKLEKFIDLGFDIQRGKIIKKSTIFNNKILMGILKKYFIKKPVIYEKKCVRCGICVEVCPVKIKAIYWQQQNKNEIPKYNYKSCIRCFCCQEMCPQKAIYIKKSFLGK